MRVYVDLDDVLSHTTPALCDLLTRRTGRVVEYESLHCFDLGQSLRLRPHELEAFMHAAHDPEHLGSLAPLDGAAATLAAWSDAGAHVSVLTGRPPRTRDASRSWLVRHGMRFDRFDCVDKYGRFDDGVPLDEILGDTFVWAVEDNLDLALRLASRCAERVLLLDRPWNRGALPPQVERVHDWDQIARIVA